MNKKLHRIAEGQKLCGVCTGLADYFNADVTVVRLIAVASCLFSGAGVIAYIAAAVIMPTE
jgi:phage shock protein C